MFSLEKNQEKVLNVRHSLKGSSSEEYISLNLNNFSVSLPVTGIIQAKTIQPHVRNTAEGLHLSQISFCSEVLLLKSNGFLELAKDSWDTDFKFSEAPMVMKALRWIKCQKMIYKLILKFI